MTNQRGLAITFYIFIIKDTIIIDIIFKTAINNAAMSQHNNITLSFFTASKPQPAHRALCLRWRLKCLYTSWGMGTQPLPHH